MICEARLTGDTLESTGLTFEPQAPPIAGPYEFDVADARAGGSAGAASLVLQTILLPLSLADEPSLVTIRGGTHVPWSPSFHYVRDVYLPMLARLGINADAELKSWGWYPAGGGEIELTVSGWDDKRATLPGSITNPGSSRGELKQIKGVAVASSLPAHIAQRMRDRASNLLAQAGLPAAVEPQRVRSVSPGAGIFLVAEYESSLAGFTALGKKGKPAEQVAEEAVDDLLTFHRGGAALDTHLTDQLILPMVSAGFTGTVRAEQLSHHSLTNLWVVEQFLGPLARIDHERNEINFLRPVSLDRTSGNLTKGN